MEDIEKDVIELAGELIDFLDNSPTAFHAGSRICDELKEVGFEELNEGQPWQIQSGKAYYVQRSTSGIVAFRVGTLPPADAGYRIIAAHTDSPSLKIKLESEIVENGVAKVGVEVYGGPILNTWLDRNLGIAGRVMVRDEKGSLPRLVTIAAPVAVIPNLAIHLNRDVNKGVELNKQVHLPAILGSVEDDENILKNLVADELDLEVDQLGEMDLFLFDTNKACLNGIDESLISSARLDNLAMCHAVLKALCDCDESESTSVGVFFDHEEIGSRSPQGADSDFVRTVLERIALIDGGVEGGYRSLANSLMISGDGAHALHPSYQDRYDLDHAPTINSGPVIKYNANLRYSTTAETAEMFSVMCESMQIPYQKAMNRSDIPSGSTVGPVCAANLGVKSVDVGCAMWGMHSIRETAGIYDHYYMTQVFTSFFSE